MKKFSSSFPAHPAGSFHYPNLPRLPVLAKYSVVKVIIIIVIIIGRRGTQYSPLATKLIIIGYHQQQNFLNHQILR